MRVIWSPGSLRQIAAIYDYISEFNPSAAQRMADDPHKAGSSLASFPHRGRSVAGTDLREWPLIQPYIIRYEIVRDEVHILRIRHGRQQSDS